MALTVAKLSGTITANQQTITLAAYTAPSGGMTLGQHVLLQFATGEACLVTDDTASPTLQVVRGYNGTLAQAHTTGEATSYGLMSDTAWPAFPARLLGAPVIQNQTQELTATGATGTTAAAVTPASFGFLSVTGASGAGLNLPIPNVGMNYTIKNNMTGALAVYCVAGTINATTGTTAFTLTATGNLMAFANCSTSGTWQIGGNT